MEWLMWEKTFNPGTRLSKGQADMSILGKIKHDLPEGRIALPSNHFLLATCFVQYQSQPTLRRCTFCLAIHTSSGVWQHIVRRSLYQLTVASFYICLSPASHLIISRAWHAGLSWIYQSLTHAHTAAVCLVSGTTRWIYNPQHLSTSIYRRQAESVRQHSKVVELVDNLFYTCFIMSRIQVVMKV